MTVPELEDALVEFIAANTSDMRYRSNVETRRMVAPQVYTVFVPRNTIGEIIPGEITTYPAIIVRAKQGVQAWEYERVTVEVIVGVFDVELDQQGSRDCLQIIERIKQRIRESDIIRQRFPVRMPLNWQINKRMSATGGGDYNAYPYYFGEMQIDFDLSTMGSQYEATTMSPDYGQGRLDEYERRN